MTQVWCYAACRSRSHLRLTTTTNKRKKGTWRGECQLSFSHFVILFQCLSFTFVKFDSGLVSIVIHLNAVEFVQIGSGNVKARTVVPALIIFNFSAIGFFQKHERGWNLKGKVWKPSVSLTFISYSKQTRESIWDESESLALSLPLKVTRVINLYWRGSQMLPWTLPGSPSHHLSGEVRWIKRLSLAPPPLSTVTPLCDVSCLRACWVIEIKRSLSEANRYLPLWVECLSRWHVLVMSGCSAVKEG